MFVQKLYIIIVDRGAWLPEIAKKLKRAGSQIC